MYILKKANFLIQRWYSNRDVLEAQQDDWGEQIESTRHGINNDQAEHLTCYETKESMSNSG